MIIIESNFYFVSLIYDLYFANENVGNPLVVLHILGQEGDFIDS